MKLRLATIAFLFGFLFIFIHGSPTHAQVSSALRHLPHERTANIPEIRDRTKLETYRSLVRNFRVDGVPHERHVNVNLKTSAGWLASVSHIDPLGITGGGPTNLYLSTDRGATRSPITNAGNGFADAGRTTLAVGKAGDLIVYAIAAIVFDDNLGTIDQLDLFRSLDGGQTWLPLHINAKIPARANQFQPNMDLISDQAFYNQLILGSNRSLAQYDLSRGRIGHRQVY